MTDLVDNCFNTVKTMAGSSTKCIYDLLTNGWGRKYQVTPLHMAREFGTTPIVTAAADVIYRAVLKEDWNAVSLSLSALETAGSAAVLDFIYRAARGVYYGEDNPSRSKKLLDLFVGGMPKIIHLPDRIHGVSWRVLIPVLILAWDAYSYTVDINGEEATWEWGSLLENMGEAAGVAAAAGAVGDTVFKTGNWMADKAWQFWNDGCKRSRSNDEFDYEELSDTNDGYGSGPLNNSLFHYAFK